MNMGFGDKKIDKAFDRWVTEDPKEQEKEQDEYYADDVECINCGEHYSYTDMSPEYVKAGYCSHGCAEQAGYFEKGE